jgi:lysophospholipase L1-like esterase
MLGGTVGAEGIFRSTAAATRVADAALVRAEGRSRVKKHLKYIAAGAALAAAFTLGTATAPPQADAADATIRFAFAGDSLTSARSSWLNQLDDPSLVEVGGFAKSGYTTKQVLAEIKPEAEIDVLVILLGTNDVHFGVPRGEVKANIDKIVDKVGAPRVLLSYIPPSDVTWSKGVNRQVESALLNRYMLNVAYHRGWMMYDPWASYRTSKNGWTPGASTDKVHPVPAVSEAAADRMEEYIRQAVEGT